MIYITSEVKFNYFYLFYFDRFIGRHVISIKENLNLINVKIQTHPVVF